LFTATRLDRYAFRGTRPLHARRSYWHVLKRVRMRICERVNSYDVARLGRQVVNSTLIDRARDRVSIVAVRKKVAGNSK
jgi:hypothetical protein